MRKNSFSLNVIFNILIKVLSALVPFIVAPYLSRVLGPDGVGSFSYANSIVSYFGLVISFGFLTYGTKKIAEVRSDEEKTNDEFWAITVVKFGIFFLVSAVYFLLIFVFDFTKGFDNGIYFCFYLLLVGNFLDLTFYFQGIEKIGLFSLINVLSNVLYMGCVFFLVKTENDLLLYTLIKSLVPVITSVTAFMFVAKKLNPRKAHLSKNGVITTFLLSFSFFIPSLIVSVTPLIDQTMLGAIRDTTEVGYYEEANKIKMIILLFAGAISAIVLSRISFLLKSGNREEAHKKMEQTEKVLLLCTIPAVFGIYGVSKYFFPAYFGEEYAQSSVIMYFLAPSILFSSLDTLFLNGYFYPSGKLKVATVMILSCDLLNVITNIPAIIFMGAAGAAMTSTISNFLLLILCVLFSRQELKVSNLVKASVKPLISAVLMFFSILMIDRFLQTHFILSNLVTSVILVGSGLFVYFIGLLVLREQMILHSFNRIFARKRALRYVRLPNVNYSNEYVFVLTNQPGYDFSKIYPGKKIKVFRPGELLCKKWSKQILTDCNNEHALKQTELFDYFNYFSALGFLNYGCDLFLVDSFELPPFNDNGCDLFLRRNRYKYVMPSRKHGLLCEWRKARNKIGFLQRLTYLIGNSFVMAKHFVINRMYQRGLESFIKKKDNDKAIEKLISCGYTNVSLIGVSHTSGASFFKGSKHNNEYFIKWNDYTETIAYENEFCKAMSPFLTDVNDWFYYDSELDSNFCVYRFTAECDLSNVPYESFNDRQQLSQYLEKLLKTFSNLGVSYNDLRPENVFYKPDSHTFWLCDWGWAESGEIVNGKTKKHVYYSKRLGDIYRCSADKTDDSISAYLILRKYGCDYKELKDLCFMKGEEKR